MTTRLEARLAVQKRRQSRRVLFFAGMLVLLVASMASGYFLFGGTLSRHKATPAGLTPVAEGKTNILVLGVDERAGDVGRSDTMFVLSVDQKTKSASLWSVPRDTRVLIPGYGWDKINAAYAYGGHELSIRTVEKLLGIPIDHYVLINFRSFTEIVDALGGVDINVEKPMHYTDPYDGSGGLHIDLAAGPQHLDGRKALEYARYRDYEGDIGRISRQQKFIKAVLAKVESPAIITKVPALIREVYGDLMKTDLSLPEMLNLARILNVAEGQGLATKMVPGTPTYISGVSYWLPNILELRKEIAQVEGIPLTDKYLTAARTAAAEYRNAGAASPKPPAAPKAGSAKTPGPVPAAKSAKPGPAAGPLRAEVINDSGLPAAGGKIAGILRAKGIAVARVVTGVPAENTVVIAYSASSAILDKLTDLPFRYDLKITNESGKANLITVVVGKDYAGKD